jgi:hypothetical protein
MDWRRKLLELPVAESLSEEAVRAAYWRAIGRMRGGDVRQSSDVRLLQTAKRELLFELGVRIPSRGRKAALD